MHTVNVVTVVMYLFDGVGEASRFSFLTCYKMGSIFEGAQGEMLNR